MNSKITTTKKSAGLFFIGVGCLEILSSFLINPWVGRTFRMFYSVGENSYDVQVVFGYFLWSLVLGILTCLLGIVIAQKKIFFIDNFALTFLVLSLFLLCDRYLLVQHKLSIWMHDATLHFKYRPNTTMYYDSHGKPKVLKTNRYGYHDNDFPEQKPEGEFRTIVLGDSITMGPGMETDETFSNQLEAILNEKGSQYQTHQVINTGISGYSTSQEYYVLQEGLKFDPDIIFVGFCMNDVTEPIVVNRKQGGTGMSSGGVMQFNNNFLGYLYHETGFGRLIQKSKFPENERDNQKLGEVYNVFNMEKALQDDEKISRGWAIVMENLENIYQTAREKKKRVVLLIFPHTFQLAREDYPGSPQNVLKDHAKKNGVDVIDFTVVFHEMLRMSLLRMDPNMVNKKALNQRTKEFLDTYYLDPDHYTEKGHKVIAEVLWGYLKGNGIITSHE